MAEIREREPYADNVFKPLKDIVALLKTYNVEFEAQLVRNIEQLPMQWQQLKQQALAKHEALQDTRYYQQQRVTALIGLHTCHVQHFAKQFQRMPVSRAPPELPPPACFGSSISVCLSHSPVLLCALSTNLRCLRPGLRASPSLWQPAAAVRTLGPAARYTRARHRHTGALPDGAAAREGKQDADDYIGEGVLSCG